MWIRQSCTALALAAALAGLLSGPARAAEDPYARPRAAMVTRILQHARALERQTGRKPPRKSVLEALARVPRHAFVPPRLKRYAYLDTPLPLGHGQSLSQPFVIALMTDLGRIAKTDVVFETGTGAGYHTALLAVLARRVVSVEVIAPLALKASAALKRLGYANATVHLGDGYYGWKAGGPYDVMIIKEAVAHIPPPLLAQLKPGGRMVIPIGPRGGTQQLTLVEKAPDGKLRETRILPVRFTPMQGGERI
jgi:protein-L-isoaspartate(D-aspartate) O-methyltransferase